MKQKKAPTESVPKAGRPMPKEPSGNRMPAVEIERTTTDAKRSSMVTPGSTAGHKNPNIEPAKGWGGASFQ